MLHIGSSDTNTRQLHEIRWKISRYKYTKKRRNLVLQGRKYKYRKGTRTKADKQIWNFASGKIIQVHFRVIDERKDRRKWVGRAARVSAFFKAAFVSPMVF
jgi:hypothetical protein